MASADEARFAVGRESFVERTFRLPWQHSLGGGRVFDRGHRQKMCFFAPKGTAIEWLGVDSLWQSDDLAACQGGLSLPRPIFFGMPFPGPLSDQPFQSPLFMIPAIECRFDRRAGQVQVRIRTFDGEGYEERLTRVRQEAQACLQAATMVPADAPAPRIMARQQWPQSPAWFEAFHTLRETLDRGGLCKVVLARQEDLHTSPLRQWSAFLAYLWDIAEPSYRFACSDGEGHLFVSRSPERLLSWQGRAVRVDAIAGTRPRGRDAEEDAALARELLASEKEMDEHRHVSRFVEDTLRAFSDGVIRERDEAIMTLRNVQHCITSFQADLRPDAHPWLVLKRLHPTPAVGGNPLTAALAFIEACEPRPRGWFAGAIGVAGDEEGDVAIGIRSAIVTEELTTLFAGAGLVEGSDPEREWKEIDAKMRTVSAYFHE